MKDDFLQPSDPKFEKVYGHNPIREAREARRKKENMRGDREFSLTYKVKKGLLKPWEADYIKKTVRERNLE